jgi:hypothetical protein
VVVLRAAFLQAVFLPAVFLPAVFLPAVFLPAGASIGRLDSSVAPVSTAMVVPPATSARLAAASFGIAIAEAPVTAEPLASAVAAALLVAAVLAAAAAPTPVRAVASRPQMVMERRPPA